MLDNKFLFNYHYFRVAGSSLLYGKGEQFYVS